MKKKLSNRDLNLLLLLAGIVLFLLAYFLCFTKLQTENEQLDSQIASAMTRLNELQNHYNNLPTYEAGISDSQATISNNLQRVPAGLKDEDFLLYLMDMNEEAGCKLTSVSFDSVSLTNQFPCMQDEEYKSFSGYRATTTSTADLSYAQLKQCIERIYSTADLTFVDSVSVTYDSETALLEGVLTVSKLYGCFEGGEDAYVPTETPEVALGTGDMFGTVQAAEGQQAAAPAN